MTNTKFLESIKKFNEARHTLKEESQKIAEMISDSLRDVIPDIEGYCDTAIGRADKIVFASTTQAKELTLPYADRSPSVFGLDFLIALMFPELQNEISGIVPIPPDMQNLVITRLRKLRGDLED